MSRQPLRPNADSRWLRQTREAVRWLKDSGCGVISSVGMQTWELITACASLERVPLHLCVVCPNECSKEKLQNKILQAFDLQADLVDIQFLRTDCKAPTCPACRGIRDKTIIRKADILAPISLSPNGNMSRLLKANGARDSSLVEHFAVRYSGRTEPLQYRIFPSNLNPELREIAKNHLFHWTRATNGLWPDERKIDYYKDLFESRAWCRDAFQTLRHIVKSDRLIASSFRMPGRIPTVSFSGLPPAAVLPLMRWRARYRRMSFEPYAIGITRRAADRIGIRPVLYFDRGKNRLSGSPDVWLSQSTGIITDWRAEREYRCRGSVRLSSVNKSELLLICRLPEEARTIAAETGLRAISYEK